MPDLLLQCHTTIQSRSALALSSEPAKIVPSYLAKGVHLSTMAKLDLLQPVYEAALD